MFVEQKFKADNLSVLSLFNDKRNNKLETIWVVTVDTNNAPINIHDIGSMNTEVTCECDFNDILKITKKDKTDRFYLIHNHPTDNPLPSYDDIQLTLNLLDFSKDNKLNFIDHYIISEDDSLSFKNSKIGFSNKNKSDYEGKIMMDCKYNYCYISGAKIKVRKRNNNNITLDKKLEE